MSAGGPPPARGQRLPWSAIPPAVAAEVGRLLGSPVARVESQPSGFSPGVAARLLLADGRRAFVKAVGPESGPVPPAIHRREARVVASLPEGAPVPRLLWSVDDPASGWVALGLEDVDGRHPEEPWRADELARVLAAMEDLAAALTPSPLPPGAAPDAGDQIADHVSGWRQLAARPDPRLDAWSRGHLAELARLEGLAPAAARGDALLHFDLRADNILLTPGRVWFVDWPHASVGAAWVDLALMAPSVAMQGGPPPEELLSRFGPARAAEPEAVAAVVAAFAGYLTYGALQPPPPGLPTLRGFQAAQAEVARGWLSRVWFGGG